jgi:hypothetical protein
MPTGGHTSLLSPDDCQTAIDEVMYEKFTDKAQPSYLSAQDSWFFHSDSIDSMAFIYDEDSNVGEFVETGEQEEVISTSTRIGNTKTKRVTKYTKQVPISWEAFKTSQKGKREEIGRQIGQRARVTQDHQSIINTYGDVTAGSINTTPDGDALASDSHTTLTGVTVDNLETAALNADNLWTVVQSLANQRAQDGDAGSHLFEGLVVPFILFKTARETLGSPLVPFSGENQLNIFETDYGQVMLRASIYLGSTYNSATNANTTYTILGREHQIRRKVLSGLETSMIEPKYTPNDTYVMRAKFAEAHFPGTWTAVVASAGTA